MLMASVITLSSDDEDNGDIQIIGEKQGVKPPIKSEKIDSVVKCNEATKQLCRRIATTLISSSVTISKVEPKCPSSDYEHLEVNGDSRHSEAKENSDDDIICLDTEPHIKNSQPNGARSPPTTCISVIKKTENKLSKSDVILLDSDDETSDRKSSKDDEDDNEVQMLEADDLSSVCRVEESSKDGKIDSQEEGEDTPGRSETTKPNQESDGPSTSRVVQPSASSSTSNSVDELSPGGPGNLTEKLLKNLNMKIKQYVGFSEENKKAVTKKIMKYYSSASQEFTQSQKFVDQIKNLIMEMSRLMALPNSKDMSVIKQITDKIKEFLGEFQRGSTQLTPKINKLHRMLDKLSRRITKLESQEVGSDSEYEDAYTMLSRYKKRALEVYNKIRQLEGKSNHADRLYLQEFIYAGVGPVPIQRALEKYYNKTKTFPDFSEVYKLVKKVNTEKDLGLTSSQVHLTAQNVFEDFGKKLKRRREYDDFLTLRSYLPECQNVDPAENDASLREKLRANKAIGKTEEDVLTDFVHQAASKKVTETKKDEETGEDEDSSKSDPEDSESEKDAPDKVFMDSDEEMEYFENVKNRRRTESDEGPLPKKMKNGGEDGEISGSTSSKNPSEEEIPEAEPTSKHIFLSHCNLEPKGSER